MSRTSTTSREIRGAARIRPASIRATIEAGPDRPLQPAEVRCRGHPRGHLGRLESEAYTLVTGAISALLGAAQEAGLLRPDIEPGDFLLLISFLWRIPPGPGAQTQADRMLGLVLDGVLSRPRA